MSKPTLGEMSMDELSKEINKGWDTVENLRDRLLAAEAELAAANVQRHKDGYATAILVLERLAANGIYSDSLRTAIRELKLASNLDP